jgi:hypothetical protein
MGRTSWNFKHIRTGKTRLLVAKHETRHRTVCQRMCSLSSKQGKHKSAKTSHVSHHIRAHFTIPNHGNGFHREITKIRQIQYTPDDHGSRLQQSSNIDTMSRNNHCRGSSCIVQCATYFQDLEPPRRSSQIAIQECPSSLEHYAQH